MEPEKNDSAERPTGFARKAARKVVAEINKAVVALFWAAVALGVLSIGIAIFSPHDREEPTPEPPSKSTAAPDWHKAESKAEVAARVLAKLESELAEVGIDGAEVVAHAKSHPLSLVSRVPEHDRRRLLVLSREDEAKISALAVQTFRKAGAIVDDKAGLARIRPLVERLVAVIPEIDTAPQVFVVRDDAVNACCFPDGTIFVNSGSLAHIRDDGLLAAVLAHELGHAAARHANEGLAKMLVAATGGVLFEEGAANVASILDSGRGVSLLRQCYGFGSQVVYTLPHSREMEAEADRLGVRYLARAGFDPGAMAEFFAFAQRGEEAEPDLLKVLLRTHPTNPKRIEHVLDVLDEPDLAVMPERTKDWEECFNETKAKAAAAKDKIAGAATNIAVRLPASATNLASRIPFPKREKSTE